MSSLSAPTLPPLSIHHHSPAISMVNASPPPPGSPTFNVNPADSGPFQGFVQKIRSFDFRNIDTKAFTKRLHIKNFSRERFLGGQLKTKNGQKYVFNGPPKGVYCSKTFIIALSVILVLAFVFSIVITYYLTVDSMTTTGQPINGHLSPSEKVAVPSEVQRLNTTPVSTASILGLSPLFGGSRAPPSPIVLNDSLSGDIISDHDILGEKSEVDKSDKKVVDQKLQLYEGWTPLHYKITIEPNLNTSSCNGTIWITIQRDSKMATFEPIVLDIHNISISNVRVIRSMPSTQMSIVSGDGIEPESTELDFDSEYGENNASFVIKVTDSESVEADVQLILLMDFVSQITDTLQGVYKTSYINAVTEKEEWMISTQFSPIDARRAFPCFDRPDKKANFTISIIRDNQLAMALSNMPLLRSSPHRPGYTLDEFSTSPRMPTYLVAFVVSNLVKAHYSDVEANLVPRVEIWSRSENTGMTNYAYTMLRKFLPYFENYFGVKNSLKKIDLVSMPNFGYGAMENWGLITFRDSALLVPEDLEKASSSKHMEYVAQIVAHELAHQWLGNLVTPKWWDDLWLKEGFATYMSYIVLNSVNPEYQILDTFTVYEFRESMQNDVDNSSHAISIDVKSTNDIRRIFDPITYSKGAILFRMLNSIVGDEAFRDATHDLLNEYAYQNADRDDLWNFMTLKAHLKGTLPESMDIKTIMDTWTSQSGYPVVNVKRRGADLLLQQERYILPTLNMQNKTRKSNWVIPITYETDELHKGDNIPTHWITPNDTEVVIHDAFLSSNNLKNVIYLNLNRQGYYRINYDMDSWLALKKNFSTLPRITRAQLLDDTLHLAQAEYLTYDIPLTFLMEIFTGVDDELLWSAAQQGLTYLVNMLQREPAYETFRAYMKFIVRPAFDHYGLNEPDNESHMQLQHRAVVAHMACRFNYDRCTMVAHQKYREWMANAKSNPIKPNLKPVIYCTALAEGSYQEWYFAYKQYKRSNSASEKEQILNSLGCTTKPWLLSKYLNMTINPTSGIQKQDGARAFCAVAKNPIGFEIAFDFLQTNIKEIATYFGDGFSTIATMIKSITSYMNKDYHKQQLEQFKQRARELGLTSVESAIELAMEQVNNNIYWREQSYYKLKGYLEAIVSEFRINIF